MECPYGWFLFSCYYCVCHVTQAQKQCEKLVGKLLDLLAINIIAAKIAHNCWTLQKCLFQRRSCQLYCITTSQDQYYIRRSMWLPRAEQQAISISLTLFHCSGFSLQWLMTQPVHIVKCLYRHQLQTKSVENLSLLENRKWQERLGEVLPSCLVLEMTFSFLIMVSMSYIYILHWTNLQQCLSLIHLLWNSLYPPHDDHRIIWSQSI